MAIRGPATEIEDRLRDKHWGWKDLDFACKWPENKTCNIIVHHDELTPKMAEDLARVLGGDFRLWAELEAEYRSEIAYRKAYQRETVKFRAMSIVHGEDFVRARSIAEAESEAERLNVLSHFQINTKA